MKRKFATIENREKVGGGGALKEELGTVALNGTALNGTMTVLMKKQYFFDARA